MNRLEQAVVRVVCVACDSELGDGVSNYCTVCLHNNELSRIGYRFFQRPRGGFPEPMEMAVEPAETQSGLGDFA